MGAWGGDPPPSPPPWISMNDTIVSLSKCMELEANCCKGTVLEANCNKNKVGEANGTAAEEDGRPTAAKGRSKVNIVNCSKVVWRWRLSTKKKNQIVS